VNRLLRLTLLAPDIVDAILEGRQPKAMQTRGSPSHRCSVVRWTSART
jgi:hypothetical protein